jgi:hypothetical protein
LWRLKDGRLWSACRLCHNGCAECGLQLNGATHADWDRDVIALLDAAIAAQE